MDQENPVVTPDQQDDAVEFETEVTEDSGAVSLEEVLGEEKPVEQPQDDAAPKAEAPAEKPVPQTNQKDIDKAIGQRLAAERKKAEQQFLNQYGADLQLAQEARKILGDNPLDSLIKKEVEEYASRNKMSIEAANDIVRWKRGLPPTQPAAPAQRDNQGRFVKQDQSNQINQRVETLTSQAQEIREKDGVNMVDVLQNDEALRDKVQNGGWDINRAYGYYLAQKDSPQKNGEQRPAAPSIVRGGTRSDVTRSIAKMSDKDFRRLDDALGKGGVVKI